jgi:hypothetical protein
VKTISIVWCVVLLAGCGAWVSTPEQQKKEDEAYYRGKSTPDNIASDPEVRALILTGATPYGFTFPQEADFVHVHSSLADTLQWYRDVMANKGFRGTLRQCTEHGIFGGRVVIVDYCSADTAVTLNLFEDTEIHETALSVSRSPRASWYRCDDPNLAEQRKLWTVGCPVELMR